MSRFSVSRSTVAEDSVAIIDQGQDEFGEGLPPQPAVAQSRSAAANLSHHMATSHNEALGLIPPVQVKQGKRSKRGSPFKKNCTCPDQMRKTESGVQWAMVGEPGPWQ
ncbi:hypothetical protein TYRP_004791 [Tyrophagus putrescentiae]|nr:hypothetical protein TYRP_004791 [Tyrophagus putrescentiae]